MKKKKLNKVIRKAFCYPARFLCALVACYFECVKVTLFGDETSTHKELAIANGISAAVSAMFLAFCPWGLTSLGYLSGSMLMRLAEALGGGIANAESLSYPIGKWLKALASSNHIGSFYNFCATETGYWLIVRFVLVLTFSIITIAMITITAMSVVNIYKECREMYVDNNYEKALFSFVRSYSRKSKVDRVLNYELDVDEFNDFCLDDIRRDYRYARFRNEPEVKELVYCMELVSFLQDYKTKETSVFDMKSDKRFQKFENEERVQKLYEAKMRRASRMA